MPTATVLLINHSYCRSIYCTHSRCDCQCRTQSRTQWELSEWLCSFSLHFNSNCIQKHLPVKVLA